MAGRKGPKFETSVSGGCPECPSPDTPDGQEINKLAATVDRGPFTPRFGGGVELVGNPTSATTLTLDDGVRTTPALTFFQVRAVNSCHHEGP